MLLLSTYIHKKKINKFTQIIIMWLATLEAPFVVYFLGQECLISWRILTKSPKSWRYVCTNFQPSSILIKLGLNHVPSYN